jgi:hypothetical protein
MLEAKTGLWGGAFIFKIRNFSYLLFPFREAWRRLSSRSVSIVKVEYYTVYLGYLLTLAHWLYPGVGGRKGAGTFKISKLLS